jgi:hypothetical protein
MSTPAANVFVVITTDCKHHHRCRYVQRLLNIIIQRHYHYLLRMYSLSSPPTAKTTTATATSNAC